MKCADKPNFAPTTLLDVSYFILNTCSKKKSLIFSETALSFSVKVKLSTFVCISFVKVWQELRTRRAFDRCEGYELSLVTL